MTEGKTQPPESSFQQTSPVTWWEETGPTKRWKNLKPRRTKVQMFWDIFWAVWLGILVIGDPIASYVFGEKATDTHFLVTHISVGLRAGVIGWIAYHFLVSHIKK